MSRTDLATEAGRASFWAKVDRSGGPAACWPWLASKTRRGYGQVSIGGRNQAAHTVAYELLVGPVGDGLEPDHTCRNHACVNPAHIEPVTHAENVLRGDSPAAQHARATTCKNGHPLSGDNLYSSGPRRCKTCTRERNRRYEQRVA